MITGLDHIQLAIPQGAEDQARAFYVGVLGMTEVAKPEILAGRGGLWLTAPGVSLHLGVEEPFSPALKAHPAFVVLSLKAACDHFDKKDVPYKADTDLPGITRVFIADPFGNRIEILERRAA